MRRRQFLGVSSAMFAGAALRPRTLRAQTMPVIGFMSTRAPGDSSHLVAAFRRGLDEGGFVEGSNVRVEYRWAGGDYTRMSSIAVELVGIPVKVLVAVGGDTSAQAAKHATSTIPVIFGSGSDPVATGLVESINLT